jgi:hypothetical protein
MQEQEPKKKQEKGSRTYGPAYPQTARTDEKLVNLAHTYHQADRSDDRKVRLDAIRTRHESIRTGTKWVVAAAVLVAVWIGVVVLASDFMNSYRPGPQTVVIKTEPAEEKK